MTNWIKINDFCLTFFTFQKEKEMWKRGKSLNRADFKTFLIYPSAAESYTTDEARQNLILESSGKLGVFLKKIGGAAITQWIRLRLPSCHPGYDSQAHHLCFYHL